MSNQLIRLIVSSESKRGRKSARVSRQTSVCGLPPVETVQKESSGKKSWMAKTVL